jgi:hypothetical protein
MVPRPKQRCKTISLAQTKPAELTDAAVRQLAERVKLTADTADPRSDSSPSFGWSLKRFFSFAAEEHALHLEFVAKQTTTAEQLKHLEAALAVVVSRLEALDPFTRYTLERYASRHAIFGPALNDEQLREQLEDIDDGYVGASSDGPLFGEAVGPQLVESFERSVQALRSAAGTCEWPQPRNRPSKLLHIGHPWCNYFDFFVVRLSTLVHRYGGRLTLDTGAGTGTAVDFLRYGAKYLPSDLIPAEVLVADGDGQLNPAFSR